MGQNVTNVQQIGPEERIQCKNIKIPFSKIPGKANFNYIKPIQCEQEQFVSMNTQPQLGSEIKDDQQMFQTGFFQTISVYKSIKEIKVKWNSFIKMKQKDYEDQYEIVKKVIGKGGFGVVRKVKSKYTHEVRVAKIIQKKSMKQQDITKLFTELFIMKMLDNPNIIKLYEVYDYEQQFVLIIEMCTGGQVYSKTKKKKLSQKKAGLVIRQLLRCLIYMHNQRIVHRDIKPQNILFQNQQQKVVKLIDFGIAKKLNPGQYFQQRIGTPAYISPDIIYKKYTQKCDIWATGVTFYQFLSGRTPFRGQDDKQTLKQILRTQLSFQGSVWQKISQNCKSLIKLMLARKQQNRPSAKQLYDNKFFIQLQNQDQKSQTSGKKQVIDNIRKFRFKNKLQAVVQTFIASQLLTKQEKQVLVEIFREFDTNNDGVISTEQLRQVLTIKKKMSNSKLQAMMRVIDINGSGQIDYTQFLVANCQSSIQLTKQRLKQVFQYFDTDRNGQITYDQVAEFLQDYQSSQQQIRKTFMLVDVNNDGSISEQEFIDLLIKKAHQIASVEFGSNVEEIADTNKQNQHNDKTIKKSNFTLSKKSKHQRARKITFDLINQIDMNKKSISKKSKK